MSYIPLSVSLQDVVGWSPAFKAMRNPMMSHYKASKDSDLALARKLILAGDHHAKAIRGIIAYFELKCQIGWFVEWNTYRVGIEVLSTSSTMHLDLKGIKGPELAARKQENLGSVIYTQGSLASYQALRRIYLQRLNHRHPDWKVFCDWIETLPHFEELINPKPSSRGD